LIQDLYHNVSLSSNFTPKGTARHSHLKVKPTTAMLDNGRLQGFGKLPAMVGVNIIYTTTMVDKTLSSLGTFFIPRPK